MPRDRTPTRPDDDKHAAGVGGISRVAALGTPGYATRGAADCVRMQACKAAHTHTGGPGSRRQHRGAATTSC